jgi:hypothetical protein
MIFFHFFIKFNFKIYLTLILLLIFTIVIDFFANFVYHFKILKVFFMKFRESSFDLIIIEYLKYQTLNNEFYLYFDDLILKFIFLHFKLIGYSYLHHLD